jgi:hypothetical protein
MLFMLVNNYTLKHINSLLMSLDNSNLYLMPVKNKR